MPNTDSSLEEKLKRLVETIDVASILTAPIRKSIKHVLRSSAAALNSEEASVLIRNGVEGDLRFLAAVGEVADQLEGVEVPAGKGVAGFVISSGQPMTISDAEQEESFYAEVDRKTGFSTQTLLATPLQYEGEMLGVLEYVNRIGEPPYEPFTPEEMDKAAFFAEVIAPLVGTYEIARSFRILGERILSNRDSEGLEEIREWLSSLREAPEHRQILDLALLVREIGLSGEAERNLCRDILESVLKYSSDDSGSQYSLL